MGCAHQHRVRIAIAGSVIIFSETALASPELLNQNGQRLGSKGRRTRQRLIEVTVELLETHGLRDLTVAEVARVAGTSPATFYVYFEGVAEVVLAALEQSTPMPLDLLALIETNWAATDPLARAQEFVQLYTTHWNEHRTIFRIRNMAAEEGDDRFYAMRIAAATPLTIAFSKKIEAAQEAGNLPDGLHAYSLAASIITLLERLSAVGPTTKPNRGISFASLIESSAFMIARTLGYN